MAWNTNNVTVIPEELRFIQKLPPVLYQNIYDLLYLHCDVSYDEVLDVAFIWKHNGQLITDKLNDRFVSLRFDTGYIILGQNVYSVN